MAFSVCEQYAKVNRLGCPLFAFFVTLLFSTNDLHVIETAVNGREKRVGKEIGYFSLTDFHSHSNLLRSVISDFLRQLYYVIRSPFVFKQNIREWSL